MLANILEAIMPGVATESFTDEVAHYIRQMLKGAAAHALHNEVHGAHITFKIDGHEFYVQFMAGNRGYRVGIEDEPQHFGSGDGTVRTVTYTWAPRRVVGEDSPSAVAGHVVSDARKLAGYTKRVDIAPLPPKVTEAIKGAEHYMWLIYSAAKPYTLLKAGSGTWLDLKRGMTFGVRPAGSKAGMYRVVDPERGPTHIWSIDHDTYRKLIAKSRPARKAPKLGVNWDPSLRSW